MSFLAYGAIVLAVLLGIMLLMTIYSLLAMAQRADDQMEQLELMECQPAEVSASCSQGTQQPKVAPLIPGPGHQERCLTPGVRKRGATTH